MQAYVVVEVHLQLFLTSAVYGETGQLCDPAVLLPTKPPRLNI
jgi:hypothetical protein